MEIYPPWRLSRNLEEEDYLKSTDDKYISCFKALIGIAEQEGIHSNHKAKGLFRHAAVKEHEKTTAVYFTK